MRAPWHALHAQLLRSTSTLRFHKQYVAIVTPNRQLARFPDPAALFDYLHAPGGDPAERNAILAALLTEAQNGAAVAVTLLLLALWPGLDAVHRRLSRHFRAEPDALVSEISGRLVAGIHALDATRVSRIAATLIMNTERDVRRGLRATRPMPPEPDHATGTSSPLGLPHGVDCDTASNLIGERLRRWIGNDAALVVAVAIHGDRQHEAGERFGIGPDAARKRYQRVIRRLRLEFDAGPCPETPRPTAFPF